MNEEGGPWLPRDQPKSSSGSPTSPTQVLQSQVPMLPWSAGKCWSREGGDGMTPLELTGGAQGYRASSVGEFKESDDWSPLLLLLR